ncbi:carbohydrate ABC transporter permease [Haloferax sp. ATB1]|uniref:carbohydrate ABC transporter permease n=1 Tax=Haloferax sp. ATB1 TaxID=1508454 RepID=UPI0006938CC2|nr:carbohydrate ABC transporter permease [Haloferax sp. ATB1]
MAESKQSGLFSYATRQRVANAIESPYIVHLTIAVGVLSVLVPLLWTFLTSLKTESAVYSLTYLPENPTLQPYYSALFEEGYWRALLNSVIISTTTTVLVLLLATPAGYAFSRYRFPFDSEIFILVLFSRLFPPIGLVIPFFEILGWVGLINTRAGIIIANVYLWLPLMVYILRNFFMSVPEELDESALVDGCTQFQAFKEIALPLALPGVAACGILTFLYSWREFLFALITSNTLQSMPVSVSVYKFVGDVSVSWASLSAASILAILPTVAVVVFFQRYIVSGLTSGALKG